MRTLRCALATGQHAKHVGTRGFRQCFLDVELFQADVQDAIAIDSSLSQSVLETEIEMDLVSLLNDSKLVLSRFHSFVIRDVCNAMVVHYEHVRVRRHSFDAGGHAQYNKVAFWDSINTL